MIDAWLENRTDWHDSQSMFTDRGCLQASPIPPAQLIDGADPPG
jgi:hypothetical protein